MTLPSTTSALIQELRQNLTQIEISRLSGIPQPKLSRWESGEVPDAADDALRLLDLVKARRAKDCGGELAE